MIPLDGLEIVDCHHHLWDLQANYYPWLTDRIGKRVCGGEPRPVRPHAGGALYEVDPLLCPRCGGTMTATAAIERPAVVRQILAPPGLPTAAPGVPGTPGRRDSG